MKNILVLDLFGQKKQFEDDILLTQLLIMTIIFSGSSILASSLGITVLIFQPLLLRFGQFVFLPHESPSFLEV